MPKIQYIEKKFSASSRLVIDNANEIIDEYVAKGFNLTLRQLYYQFVSRDLIANKQSEYKRLGNIINDARLAGEIDWSAIEDRTRNVRKNSHWGGPGEIVRACSEQYEIDKWANQDYRIEVWIEKDALIGVIENICGINDVPYFSCRGYTSQSEMWRAARRLRKYKKFHDQIPIIIHLGDHDPSGIDMTCDIENRMRLFMGGVDVNRIALNRDQIEKFNPPPNPAKTKDSWYEAYIIKYGQESWELDALKPEVIVELIERTIAEYKDADKWSHMVAEEEKAKISLREIANQMEE